MKTYSIYIFRCRVLLFLIYKRIKKYEVNLIEAGTSCKGLNVVVPQGYILNEYSHTHFGFMVSLFSFRYFSYDK